MKLLRDKYAHGLSFDNPDKQLCEICVKGKQARQQFSKVNEKEKRALKLLQIVHTDIYDPMEKTSIGGSRYFILFIDDYSRQVIYFLKNKNKVLDAFKIYKAYVEKQTGYQILALRLDNGREFVNKEFKFFSGEKKSNIN